MAMAVTMNTGEDRHFSPHRDEVDETIIVEGIQRN